ncbi:hypothetical protein RJZ56_002952 [Blastomyces dermatitidis]|uniref:YDG domain-containing protein n=1 Tax=Blastomyces gilchristii (strain SLH14081) TaxID=559298 RepID=A0A179V0Y7_BLAGS|nr:uncharacterized protein BDBG_09099 [Blastomyces gilchristii SLH14081]OAT14006.1 hypothetical protein BDBG_09099 [Blastomyces gilchristii SLH14081]
MEPGNVKPEPNQTQGIISIPNRPFAEKVAAALKELRQKQSASTPPAAILTPTSVTPASGTTATPATGAMDAADSSDLQIEETESASALEETTTRVDRPITLQQPEERLAAKRKRPALDPLKCTCAVSEKCLRAARDGVVDCRIGSGAPIPKRKQTRVGPRPGRENEPFRYISPKERGRLQRSADDVLSLLTLFKRASTAPEGERPAIFNGMRGRIQQLQFYDVSAALPSLLQKFMDYNTGLPAIVNSPDDAVPWDIKLDCEAILFRWQRGDFDPNLLRGIMTAERNRSARKLDPTYKFKRDSIVVGDNHLRNGQWFPLQITTIRDGAHGEMEAGISGRNKVGAVSIILSSAGKGYPDVDQGDTIAYCGTHGKDGQISAGTNLLIESHANRTPIRVLRSSKLPKINPYRPVAGFRYDGLYEIHGVDVLDSQTMLHRFKLRRIAGQTPIRYQGEERRPTVREVEEWRILQNLDASSKLK